MHGPPLSFKTRCRANLLHLASSGECLARNSSVLYCHHLCDLPATFGSYRPCSSLFEHHEFPMCVVHQLGIFSPHLCHRSAVSDSVPTYSPTRLQPNIRPSVLSIGISKQYRPYHDCFLPPVHGQCSQLTSISKPTTPSAPLHNHSQAFHSPTHYARPFTRKVTQHQTETCKVAPPSTMDIPSIAAYQALLHR
ncbi:hypothetical protein IQ06DRAFT_75639 [Phaeosphaeriaceae sp. SRC1lsM3a]|nr:hypothetical protein IQ06DRAFT_75639 [Stagonospora sp. SRC1lsM3a]